MSRLSWGVPGERYYESGVDQGVLYLDGEGYAWSGLVSVNETPSGGDPKPLYLDGIKYLNLSSAEEFEATITAFGSPAAFAECDGIASVQNGLFVTHQRRRTFDFSYRTLVGNDVDGLSHGYKIHIVYGALAAPSQRTNKAVANPEPLELSWKITTLPPMLTGYRPTAHLVVDSRLTPVGLLAEIEALLYGDDLSDPSLPTQQEIFDLFVNYIEVYDAGDPSTVVAQSIDGGSPSTPQTMFVDGGGL